MPAPSDLSGLLWWATSASGRYDATTGGSSVTVLAGREHEHPAVGVASWAGSTRAGQSPAPSLTPHAAVVPDTVAGEARDVAVLDRRSGTKLAGSHDVPSLNQGVRCGQGRRVSLAPVRPACIVSHLARRPGYSTAEGGAA